MAGKYGLKLNSGGIAADYTMGVANFDRLRKERLAKAQASLKKNKLAAVLLLKSPNIRYVTSVKAPDWLDGISYCLAFAEHPPILFPHHGKPMGDCPWIKPEQSKIPYHWAQQSVGEEASWAAAKRFAASIKKELKQKGLAGEKLGVDAIDEVGRAALVAAGIEVVNGWPAMLEARAVKTQDEINLLHMATANADVAHYAIYEALKPGVRERDLMAVAYDSLLRAGAEIQEGVYIRTGGVIAGGTVNSDRVIQPGDQVTVDIVRCTYMGYQTCYYRNYLVTRKPTEKEKDMHKRCYERMYRVIDAIKPGVTTADTAKYWNTYRQKGYVSEEWAWCDDIAHGIGLSLYEYPVSNRLYSLDHPQVYEKGMTLAAEAQEFDPMVGRLKLEEMLVVTDDGCEIWSRMPVKEIMISHPIITADM